MPSQNYDEKQNDRFELMNVRIVVYGLTGLVCEEEPKRKQKFGKKGTIVRAAIGIARKDIKPLGPSNATNEQSDTEATRKKNFDTTTAVVSCHKDGTSNDISFETFLPSVPLGNPIATSLNKFSYAASWPSNQLVLEHDEGAKDRSSFAVTRCMKQASFIPGIGARPNYCHETIELGINISRGTELIRLGTALIVIDGEEEGEVEMNVSTTPLEFNSKKLKKKKNKYGYFSNDPSTRFSLEKNSVLKVGVQAIPEEAMRFAREKEKKRKKNETQLNELLEQDEFQTILREMSNDNLGRERRQNKSLPLSQQMAVDSRKEGRGGTMNLSFPGILCGSCGSIPSAWVPNFFKRPENEPNIPNEIFADDNVDQFLIHSLLSSVSEATDGSDILEGKQYG
jgi:hypothetical protein